MDTHTCASSRSANMLLVGGLIAATDDADEAMDEEPADGKDAPTEEHPWTEMIGVDAATSNAFSLSIARGVDYAPMLPDQDPAHATTQADAVADGSSGPGVSPLIAAVPDDPGAERP